MNPNTKTIILLSVLTFILVVLGFFISGWTGALIFLTFSLFIDIISYWFSDKIALYSAKAKEIYEQEAHDIFADLKELSAKFSIPTPKLYISPSQQANAFATGRDLGHSTICLTEGILKQLNRDQIRAVMAHELSHIRSHDVLIGTVAALLSSSIASIAQFGGLLNSEEEENNPIVSLLLIIFAPIAALLLQLAISRQREFSADNASARITGRPRDLADALLNIESSAENFPMSVNPGFASLYVINPLHLKGVMGLFSTHPSTEERVRRLYALQA
ncbi:MAG: M48 family metalloprotease [Candidatus Dojkabacteria bacterium]